MGRWVSSPNYRAAVRVLVEARESAGMTQRDLAAKLGKPPSFVAKIEVGERKIDLVEFIAIGRALGEPGAALFERVLAALPSDLEL